MKKANWAFTPCLKDIIFYIRKQYIFYTNYSFKL